MPSDLERVAAQFRAELLRNDARAAQHLVEAYGAAYGRIAGLLAAITDRLAEARQRGEKPGISWLFQQERLQRFVVQVAEQIGVFAVTAATVITRQQTAAVSLAQTHAAELIRVAAEPAPGEAAPFVRLPTTATEKLVGNLSNGSPLRSLLDELGSEASASARKRLIQGVATGQGPRAIATGLRDDLGGNLNRALTIARTETIRPYREVTRDTYQANADFVEGWIWYAALSGRTCAACLALHGTIHPLSEPLESHPCCRCTMLAYTGRRQVETGEDWLRRQPEAVQAQALGDEGAALFRSGDVLLSDFVKTSHSDEWGTTRTARGVRGAREAAQRRAA